jgi:hypothetical protein
MQAIITKYIGPSNVKGVRIKATCQAGSITLSWDHALNADGNHCAAAKALAEKWGWNFGEWIGGQLPDGSNAWVCRDTRSHDAFTLAV